MKKPLTKEYHLNMIEFPTAAESREITLINIGNLLKDEIHNVFTSIKSNRSDGKISVRFDGILDYRTIYYLECKEYIVTPHYNNSIMKYVEISW